MNKLIIPSKTERLIQKNDFFLTRGHDFVEIGGVKWATCNIGAKKPTDPGLYFQCGDTQGYTAKQVGYSEGKKDFRWNDYKHYDIGYGLLKYNGTDSKTVLDVEDDAAHVNWGGAWRMPTKEEFDALCKAVNTVWSDNYQGSGMAGFVCVDKTDSSKELFLPAAGFAHNREISNVNVYGLYWSKSLNRTFISYCHDLIFAKKMFRRCDYSRCSGQTIRAVLDI